MVSPATTNRQPNRQDGQGEAPSGGAVLSWRPGKGGEAKELITVEKDKTTQFQIPEIALKTILEDGDQALDFAQAIHHCLEFEMLDMLKEIYTLMALKPAVKGLSRHQYLEALTGVMWDPESKRGFHKKDGGERDKGMYNKPPTS